VPIASSASCSLTKQRRITAGCSSFASKIWSTFHKERIGHSIGPGCAIAAPSPSTCTPDNQAVGSCLPTTAIAALTLTRLTSPPNQITARSTSPPLPRHIDRPSLTPEREREREREGDREREGQSRQRETHSLTHLFDNHSQSLQSQLAARAPVPFSHREGGACFDSHSAESPRLARVHHHRPRHLHEEEGRASRGGRGEEG
jgi:hypothetical protein